MEKSAVEDLFESVSGAGGLITGISSAVCNCSSFDFLIFSLLSAIFSTILAHPFMPEPESL
jgi:hypothetical protein